MAAAAITLAACSTTNVHTGPAGAGMMANGAGMMGTAPPGYTWSRPTCTPPTDLPAPMVRVVLGDMGMARMMSGVAPLGSHMMLRAVPTSVPAGPVGLVVYNMGWRTHEVVVLPLAPGETAGQRAPGADGTIDESGSLGEVSNTCAPGTGDGIAAGAAGWATLTLATGRYELVCNEPNHYADGMYAEIDVS